MTLIQTIILGITQGVFEWLPVSSEGLIVLINNTFFSATSGFSDSIELALFLHLGTVTAAIVFFWKDIVDIGKNIFNYRSISTENKTEINFYFFVTLTSAIVGLGVLALLSKFETLFLNNARAVSVFIAIMLFITAYLLSIRNNVQEKNISKATFKNMVILGFFQGLTPIPGISRSGTTVSILLLQKFSAASALRASFILSIPLVLAANIGLLIGGFAITSMHLVGFFTSFIFGYATIKMLLKLALRLNFSRFVFIFAILVLLSSFL